MKKTPSRPGYLFASLLILVSFTAASKAVHGQAVSHPKVAQLLAETGYQVRATGNGTWVIEMQGTQKGKMYMLVASGADFVVFGVIVAQKKEMNVTAELMFKLMKFNHKYDYVKIGFDDDDDLFLRAEVKTKMLDRTELKDSIELVRKDADEIYGAVKPYLTGR